MIKSIFILTPCMNAVDTIDRTIMSVVTQAGDFKIRYHIQDAGSTDGTYERVLWWKARLESPDFPIQCKGIEFSVVSEPDEGLYDGLIRGFKHMHIRPDDFMAWINADDVLMVGALSLISQVRSQFSKEQASWVGGGCAIVKNNHITTNNDRKVPTEAIRLGLCDGMHWDFIQQEGTFFRKWLWDSINPEVSIGKLKLAGDWNLWRLFAQQASLVQFTAALGGFRRRDGQLSAVQRDKYMNEISSLVSPEERKK
ncbi:MAG: glycosyltransferase, partial [Asticcacaulis sp.]